MYVLMNHRKIVFILKKIREYLNSFEGTKKKEERTYN